MYSSGKAPTWPGRSESSYRAVCLARHKQVVTHGAWRQTEGLLAVLSQQWAAGLLTEQRAASLLWKPLLGARVTLEVQACMSLGFNTNVSIPVLLWPVALGPAFFVLGFEQWIHSCSPVPLSVVGPMQHLATLTERIWWILRALAFDHRISPLTSFSLAIAVLSL